MYSALSGPRELKPRWTHKKPAACTVYAAAPYHIYLIPLIVIRCELGCPLISLGSGTKAKMSEAKLRKKRVSFVCFALKRNEIFWMGNEMIQSEKYRKYRKFCTEK